ncbi:hypothetical protein D3C80_585420 [compost metagenome]
MHGRRTSMPPVDRTVVGMNIDRMPVTIATSTRPQCTVMVLYRMVSLTSTIKSAR